MNPVAVHFGENLCHLRKKAELSQEALGYLSSLHRTEIGLLERGARVPRIDTLVKIAISLELPLECPLLEGIRWRPTRAEAGGFEVSSDA